MDEIKRFLDGPLLKSAPGRPAWNREALLGHIRPVWNYIDGCMIKDEPLLSLAMANIVRQASP